MTICKKEEKITPMYIVGTINDGKFKQALHYGWHSGNRLKCLIVQKIFKTINYNRIWF